MSHTFFSKTDKRLKKRFFNPPGIITSDDASAHSEQDSTSGTIFRPIDDTITSNSHRRLRLLRSKESAEDLLERLLRNAENTGGQACSNYLEQLLHFLKRNPTFVNRVPNKYHSNALELVIKLGDYRVAKELIALNAYVRPENRSLMKKIAHLLKPHQLQHDYQPTISFKK